MKPHAPKIIKSHKFEDGSFTIQAPPSPAPLGVSDPLSSLRSQAEQIIAEAEAEALAMARDVLSQAEAEAEALRAQVREEAEVLRAQVLEAGQAAGFAAGLEAARAEAKRELFETQTQLLGGLAAAYEEAAHDRARWLAEHEQDLVRLSVLVAQKILLMELSTSRQSVLALAEAALQRIVDKVNVRVRVHPEDLPMLRAARESLLLSADNLTTFDVIGDPRVGLGGCMVDTRTGTVDARLSTQLSEVAMTLLELPPGTEDALDPALALAIRALGEPIAPPRVAPARAAEPAALPAAPGPVRAAEPVAVAPEVPAAPAPVEPPLVEPQPVEAAPAPAAAPSMAEAAALEAPEAAPGEWLTATVPALVTPVEAEPELAEPVVRAADALAVRLGKKKPPQASAEDPEEAEPAEAPNLDRAADRLSRMLGKGPKPAKRAWHGELE